MNKALVNHTFPIPKEIINALHTALQKHPHHQGEGIKRCERLIMDKKLTYQQIKRLIHDLKYMDPQADPASYELNGGDAMKTWANRVLDDARKQVDNTKMARKRANDIGGMNGMRKNAYLSTHEKNGTATVNDILSGNKELAGGLTPTISEEVERICSIMNKIK